VTEGWAGATVAVVGAGTMGAGIAQVAAVAGHPVLLHDSAPGAAARAEAGIRDRLAGQVAKGRITAEQAANAQLTVVDQVGDLAPARIVVEAVLEDLAVKQALFADLEGIVAADCVLATNTSSLSPTAIAGPLAHPERVVGLHFFNPVPVMRLVEVIAGLATDPAVAGAVSDLARSWGKTVVRSTPAPGFIVNRIARPFYGEAWRLYAEGAAEPAVIDAVLTGAAGFRIGPFQVMDLVGHDVNLAVSRSVWSAFGNDPRYTPAQGQQELVAAGRLGRKSGHGIYPYAQGVTAEPPPPLPARPAPDGIVLRGEPGDIAGLVRRSGVSASTGGGYGNRPGGVADLSGGALLARCTGVPATVLAADLGVPVVLVDRTIDDDAAKAIAITASDGCPQAAVDHAVGLLQAGGLAVYQVDDAPGMVVTRTVAMLVAAGVDALHHGVAGAADIDEAMRLGVSYPLGPLEWGDRWGARTVLAILDTLAAQYGDPHYRVSPLLRRRAAAGLPLAADR
jgi:3-hydroxybutyryl-CoA dehydrogenase